MAQGVSFTGNGARSWQTRSQDVSGMGQRKQEDAKRWEEMLKMINQSTPQTMLGYGLGKLLKKGWKLLEADYNKNKINKAQNGGKDIQGSADNTAYTIGGIDPRTATVDEGQTIYGITPTKGLLGDRMLGIGQQQTTQETTQPNGQRNSTTTTDTYAFNPNDYPIAAPEQLSLNEMAARQILGNNDPYGLNSKKNPLGNINLRY